MDLERPADLLLTTGGDERLVVDPDSGLNRYGCSPRPRPWAITFASTTATSVSDGAYAHVEGLRRRLAEAAKAGRLDQEYAAAMEEVRAEVPHQCGMVPGTEAILTPSGTDAEFYALHLALAADRRPLTSIVIAPRETASNVLQAASGRHYNATTAMGHHVSVDAPVDDATAARVELAILQVRDEAGTPLPVAEIDRAAEALVEREIAKGRRVLLHLLDTSKTGLVAPGVAFTFALAERFAGHLDVVVDASQLRLSRESVARYLGHGFMVIVTGSKFFTGPPFAGALLVPPSIGGRGLLGLAALPGGYNAYTERHCWPDAWESWCRPMGGEPNIGLLMRWWSSLRPWIEVSDTLPQVAISPTPYFESLDAQFRVLLLNVLVGAATAQVSPEHFRRFAQAWPPGRPLPADCGHDVFIQAFDAQLRTVSSAHLQYLCELACHAAGVTRAAV